MQNITPWDEFFKDKIKKIFIEKESVIDIGGSLRVVRDKSNRYESGREWIRPYMEKVDYKILDPVDTYNPDIVGDVHNLPFPDNSINAIVCISILEHVENPIKAWQEIHRVLKPGGFCFIYVPFLYYYHAEEGYYGDFWRFTADSIQNLSRPYSSIEISPVRGAIETWIKLSPLGRIPILNPFWYFLDKITGKIQSNQVSGYNVFLIK